MLELVQKYVPKAKIKRSGADQIVITCPFHAGGMERTPSLFINVTNGLWYCQGCKIGGGFKKFLASLGLDRGTIDDETRDLNVAIKEYAEKKEYQKKTLFYNDPFLVDPILNETLLIKYAIEPQFLINKGFDPEVLKKYEVGFDIDRQRVIYPVRDLYGNLAGVSGGTVIGAEPKYRLYPGRMFINNEWIPSPFGIEFDQEHPTYTPDAWKSRCLWNFDRVYASCLYSTKVETIVIVEGFKAALWLIQNGYRNVTALMSSTVSELQYVMLSRLNCNLLLMLDNDDAGRKCSHNILSTFAGITPVCEVQYSEYHQPDDVPAKELHVKIIKARRSINERNKGNVS
jgi:DNA primase